jgi:NlpC/P60 family putative phage cell wall peptidase
MAHGIMNRAAIVAAARRWIGTPYHHQAACLGAGCDCIGLVRGLWREFYGTEAEPLPGYSRDWAEASGEETLLSAARRHLVATAVAEARPGDVVLFRLRAGLPVKHAAVLATADTMIHAMEGVPVSEVTLSPWWRRRIAGVFAYPGVTD